MAIRGFHIAGLILVWTCVCAGQDARQASDWKKMYDDASAQLRAAQDRKSELAGENAKLTARVAELEKQLAAAQPELENLRRHADSYSEQTFALRAYYMGWEAFIGQNPEIEVRWRLYWGDTLPWLPGRYTGLFDPQWPFLVP